MADFPIPISALPPASTPLTGNEVIPLVQGGATKAALVSSIVQSTVFGPSQGGVVPASGGGTATALRADGTWTSTFTGTWTFATVNVTTAVNVTGPVSVTGVVTASSLLLGAGAAPAYDPATGNIGYYARTAAEISAAVTPVSYAYQPGDLRRYGCDLTGGTDNSAQITNAIAAAVAGNGVGYIYHPGGTISHASQITIPNGLTVMGFSRLESTFQFTGSPATSPAATRSAWRYTGVAPWSGFANVAFRHVRIVYLNSINFAAAIELSAWGWAYFELDDVWIRGGCSYGIVLDGTEIISVHNCLIENQNAVSNYNVWIVNGADRGFTQGLGFSNVITVRECQISGGAGSFGLIDDGGNQHVVQGNNFNGHRIPMRVAGAQGIKITGNSFETQLQTGNSNLDFDSVSASGAPVGPVTGFEITANGFFGNMVSGSLLAFGGSLYSISGISLAASAVVTFSTVSTANPFVVGQQIYFANITGTVQLNGRSGQITAIGGASGAWTATIAINSSGFSAWVSGGQGLQMHSGGFVKGNNFGSQLGRGAAIDVTFLANSEVSASYDLGTVGMFHYTGVHNDNVGNILLPPQNGALPTLNITGPTYGDLRFPSLFVAGISLDGPLNLSTPAPGAQSGAVYQGTGAPSNSNGANGDVYFRTDTPATANQRMYIKAAGSWSGIL